IQGYLFTEPDGQVIPSAPDQILHHKNFYPKAAHPFPHKGMGIVEAAAFAIDTDNEARKWNLNFFKNAARPDGILITDGYSVSDSA
ncbi:phage portal protein, partial [Acinetobacter baumannii]|uniref:phage portal protein n=1 Tax=Acinetobacter baumannii TaxID=470 RepID=UPI0028935DFF